MEFLWINFFVDRSFCIFFFEFFYVREYLVGLVIIGRKEICESCLCCVEFGGDNLYMLLFKYLSRFFDICRVLFLLLEVNVVVNIVFL